MYTIEMVTDNDDIVIYHQNGSQEPLPCYGPKLSQEVNEAGSLTFTPGQVRGCRVGVGL